MELRQTQSHLSGCWHDSIGFGAHSSAQDMRCGALQLKSSTILIFASYVSLAENESMENKEIRTRPLTGQQRLRSNEFYFYFWQNRPNATAFGLQDGYIHHLGAESQDKEHTTRQGIRILSSTEQEKMNGQGRSRKLDYREPRTQSLSLSLSVVTTSQSGSNLSLQRCRITTGLAGCGVLPLDFLYCSLVLNSTQ